MSEAAFLNHVLEVGLWQKTFVFLVKRLENSCPICNISLQNLRHEFVPNVFGKFVHIVELVYVAVQFDYLVEGCFQTFRIFSEVEVLDL